MEADKQRGSIVLTKQNIDGQDYIRIDYGNNQAIALLLSEDSGIKIAGNGSAYIQASAFRLPAFYDRYSPTPTLITAVYMYGIPNLSGNICYRKAIWNCWSKSDTAFPP